MTDYIKFPTFQSQDLLRGVEPISAYPRINPQQPHPEGYSRQATDYQPKKEKRAPRRFVAIRRLIDDLQELSQISKVDFATADAEMHRLGYMIVEEELTPNLLRLKFPINSIERLLLQISGRPNRVKLGPDRISTESILFPVSTEGMTEYNLKIEELNIQPGNFDRKIVEQIDLEGLFIEQQKRLRLTFSRLGPVQEKEDELLKLKISVLLGVIESDEADRRAILYLREDNSYGLYADKLINLSI